MAYSIPPRDQPSGAHWEMEGKWKANGHKQGPIKGETGDSADSTYKVFKRHAVNKSATFLFKKDQEK